MVETFLKEATLEQNSAPRIRWRTPAAIVAATGLVALCAHISVPLGFTPVPLTMQTFAVLLIGLLLSPRAAFAALALYLLEGASGLPVFSPLFPAGAAQLIGPTGGYLLAYPFAAALASLLYRSARRGVVASLVATSVASVFILMVGAIWIGVLTRESFSALFVQSVAPFLPGDTVKAAAAALCVSAFSRLRKQA